MSGTPDLNLLPVFEALGRLHEHSPAMRLETAQLPAAELAVRLETGDIDLAVGYLPQLLFGDRAPRRQRSGA